MKRFLTIIFILILSFEIIFFVQQSEKIRALKAIPVVYDSRSPQSEEREAASDSSEKSYPKIKRPSASQINTPSVRSAVKTAPVKRLLADRDYARELDQHLSESTVINTLDSDQLTIDHKKSILYKALNKLPQAHQDAIKFLILKEETDPNRGLGGQNTIILHSGKLPDAELLGVFIHEMGHVVDTGLFRGNSTGKGSTFTDGQNMVYDNDPSISFYEISWNSTTAKQPDTSSLDFVSGYAMTDPFEDFAESYVFYVVHGNTFRKIAGTNEKLQRKYNFLKNIVFNGKEYETGSRSVDNNERSYDATLQSFDLMSFLKFG